MTSYPTDTPAALDLQNEVAATREVLDGLLRLWRAQTDLSIDDARRLSVLVFNGARTAAILITHQVRLADRTPDTDWMDAVLDQFGQGLEIDL